MLSITIVIGRKDGLETTSKIFGNTELALTVLKEIIAEINDEAEAHDTNNPIVTTKITIS